MIRATAVVVLAGCLDPLVSDATGPSGQLLPAGTSVPAADDDPLMLAHMRSGLHVDGVVPLHAAFGGGTPVMVWDFGPAPTHSIPMFVLVDADGTPIEHPEIVDFAPGDPGYSPFWAVWTATITDRYAGEQITSIAALREALDRGLVEKPTPTGAAEHGPIVTRDLALEAGEGEPPEMADDLFYYRGVTVVYFDLGDVDLEADHVGIEVGRRYVLRRDGGEPLSEVVRGVDMDGDGDAVDTNDIFTESGDAITGAFTTVDVAVPTNVASIDTTRDQTRADDRDEAQLFVPVADDLNPVSGAVVSFSTTDEVRELAERSALQ